jgi:hypothetical protein
MNIEEKLRGALDAPAPPPTTTLDVVLKRGRRRVFAQRAGAMLGVAAVVVGIGIGAGALNHAAPAHTPADQPNEEPSVVEHALGWPRVNTPAQQPYGTWTPASTAPPPPGSPILTLPRCDMQPRKLQESISIGSEELPAEFIDKWIGTVRQQLPGVQVGTLSPRIGHPTYEVDLTDQGGTGSVSLSAGRFTGPAVQYADDSLWFTGDCEPPYRQVLPDGTIVQLHGMHVFEPFQTLEQVMTVFRPDGRAFRLVQHNYGSKDMRPDPKQAGVWERIGAGRPNLPLSEEQFARLGPAIAGVA